MTRPFLTARWEQVVLVSYQAPPELLLPHLPPGIELDTFDDEGQLHLVSVVALRFRALRVRGIRVPSAQDFAEINLRFYARRGAERGAVFLREYVSHPLVILGARLFYGEPYRRAGVGHIAVDEGDSVRIATAFSRGGGDGQISLVADAASAIPPADGLAHWLKERYAGFGRGRGGSTMRYRVTHPVWATHRVREASPGIDPGLLMEGEWRDIDWASMHHSTVVAAGSPAAIYPPERVS